MVPRLLDESAILWYPATRSTCKNMTGRPWISPLKSKLQYRAGWKLPRSICSTWQVQYLELKDWSTPGERCSDTQTLPWLSSHFFLLCVQSFPKKKSWTVKTCSPRMSCSPHHPKSRLWIKAVAPLASSFFELLLTRDYDSRHVFYCNMYQGWTRWWWRVWKHSILCSVCQNL